MKQFLFFCCLWAMTAQAQTAVDKAAVNVIKAENKVNQASTTINKVDGIKKSIGKLFGKKKADTSATVTPPPPSTATAIPTGVHQTVITFLGADYSKLKAINEGVVTCSGIQSSYMKVDGDSSMLYIVHTGTTEQMMKLVFTACKDHFTEKNITAFEEGKVNLKI